jgi:hypothetical protein
MRELRELEVQINARTFDDIEGKYAWEHEFEESELANLSISKSLAQIQTLKKFNLSTGHCRYANTSTKKETFENNVRALESVIKKGIESIDHSTAPHAPSKATRSTCVPLYYDSKVCSGCSKVHSPKHREMRFSTGRVDKRLNRPERKRRYIRTASLPNSKNKIYELIRSHTSQVIDYLFDFKQQYNAEKEAEWDDVRM